MSLVGFLMFGNLIRECGVLESLSKTAQHELANLITLLLGITCLLYTSWTRRGGKDRRGRICHRMNCCWGWRRPA